MAKFPGSNEQRPSSSDVYFRSKLLLPPWRFEAFAEVSSNFCRGILKHLPWCLQTFAAVSLKFCRGLFKRLPWCFETFAVVSLNFCRVVFKLSVCRGVLKHSPWFFQTFAAMSKLFFCWYRAGVCHLKLVGLDTNKCWIFQWIFRLIFQCYDNLNRHLTKDWLRTSKAFRTASHRNSSLGAPDWMLR